MTSFIAGEFPLQIIRRVFAVTKGKVPYTNSLDRQRKSHLVAEAKKQIGRAVLTRDQVTRGENIRLHKLTA